MRAVIMAGGFGTRIRTLTKDEIPKAMLKMKNKPIVEWQIDRFKEYGITDVTMIIGYLGDVIEDYFGDGKDFGVNIDYIREEEPLGTAGAFYYLKDRLREHDDEEFLLTMGDIFFDFDIDRMISYHHETGADITLLAHPNMHPYDSDLIVAGKDGRVTKFDSKHNIRDYCYDNCVNAGIFLMKADVCELVAEPKKLSLEKDVIAPNLENKKVYAYRTPEFIRDVGTVDRVKKTIEDIDSGIVAAKNLKNRQKAIFIDRDGTMNVFKGFITDPEMLELIENTSEAIKLINSSGYLAIMITNQPAIARGEVTFEGVDTIMNKLKMLLGEDGAYMDDIYYCPHHPDSGFEGEVKELKIKCHCRKPETGMIEAAAEKYNIDLSESWMVGDMTMDILCGNRAGCHTCLVRTGKAGLDGKYEAQPEIIKDDLYTFVKELFG